MIKPQESWKRFTSDDEKLQKYKEWGFISSRQTWLNTLFYCGAFIDKPKICDIVGYIDNKQIVISVDSELHTIHPDYLLQMQSAPPTAYPDKYIVLDLETTGFSAMKDSILEIAAVKYRQCESLDTFHTMVKPNCQLKLSAKTVNHIDESLICDAPTFENVLPQFIAFIGDLPLVAHNASFDLGFLKEKSKISKIKISNTVFDTLKLSRAAFPNIKSHSLSSLVEELNISVQNTHRALPDVQATATLFQLCLHKLYPATKLAYQGP